MSKRGWVDGPRDRSSWSRRDVMDSVVPYFANSSYSLFITLDGRYDGSSQALRSVEGLRSITLKLLEFGYWTTSMISTKNQKDGPSWLRRSVMATTVRHALHNPRLVQTSPSSFSSFTTMPPTHHHRHDEPSQAP
ncbi:hypothetical protein EJD97_000268 [Solanum chilense]|uniref:Uncharacterized protein n=1 Tax=Solanum chilense TaxID=4083 RepID=A0A6N2AQT1_SOLCI|nr:hypothetical protein EJD97_000268 [Solanum chilense]